jgi:hypothetical protein
MAEIKHAPESVAVDHIEDKDSSQLSDDNKPFTWQSILAVCVCTNQQLF